MNADTYKINLVTRNAPIKAKIAINVILDASVCNFEVWKFVNFRRDYKVIWSLLNWLCIRSKAVGKSRISTDYEKRK